MNNINAVSGLALLVGAGWLIYLLAPVLTPFLVAALLAYIGNPAVTGLQRWCLPRWLAVLAVFAVFEALFTGLLVFLVPRVEQAMVVFIGKLPGYLDVLQHNLLPRLRAQWGIEFTLDVETLKSAALAHWQDLGNVLRQTLAYVTQSGVGLVLLLLNLVLIPIVTFYLLLDWERLLAGVLKLLPPAQQGRALKLARETDAVLGSFLRGQVSVMLALAVVYSSGLWLLGLDLALPIGLFTGLVSFVPYLGFISGVTAAGIAAYLQFHDAWMLLWVFGVFLIGQLLEGLVLTPRLVGGRIGLHPVAVIFAIMAGGQLFGFIGVLLALPAAAVLKVWLSHLHEYYVTPRKSRRPTARSR